MRRLLGKISGFLSNRTTVGVDKTGNKYFTRNEEVDGIMKEKRWVIFKGEEDPTSIPVEWICWLNGQRKKAPTPEEMMELEARRECVRQNVARMCQLYFHLYSHLTLSSAFHVIVLILNIMKQHYWPSLVLYRDLITNSFFSHKVLKKEEERIAKEGSKGKRVSTGKVSGPDLKSFIQQFPVPSEGKEVEESPSAMDGLRNPQESLAEKEKDESESSEPTGSGASFRPGTWQPPT
ncbi:hypothetical protein HKD37_08G023641 [Glycine soja]